MAEAFEQDAEFMAWLIEYFKDCGGWELEHTGNILAMYEAFKAGRALKGK